MKYRHLLLSVAAICMVVATPSALAMKKWYGGIFASNSQAHSTYEYNVLDLTTPFTQLSLRGNLVGNSFGGGLLLGFWLPNGRNSYGLVLDASALGGPGAEERDRQDGAIGGVPAELETNLALRYTANLALAYLFQVTHHFSIALKLGASLANYRYVIEVQDASNLFFFTPSRVEERHTCFGWMFGALVQWRVDPKWAVFAEFDRASLGSRSLATLFLPFNLSVGQVARNLQNLNVNTFKLGVTYTFADM